MSSTLDGARELGPRLGGALFASALSLAVLAVELPGLAALAAGRAELGFVLAAHASLSISLGVVAFGHHRWAADSRLVLLLATTTWVLGPFGAAGCLLTLALNRWYERAARPFREWYQALFPEASETLSERVYARVRRMLEVEGEAGGPSPFADVLASGSLEEKQAVVAVVSKHFEPAFAPILRLALRDSANAVRVQAATAIAVVESRFSERIQEIARHPEGGEDRAEATLELARLYDDYAFTGILDDEREEDNRRRAFAAYESYVALRPDDVEAKLAAGRVLLRSRRYGEAARFFERSFAGGFPTPRASLWYMECLYHLGRFQELRELARSCDTGLETEDDALPRTALEAVRLWSGAVGEGA